MAERDRDSPPLDLRHGALEAAKLLLGVAFIPCVRQGEVGKHPFQFHGGKRRHRSGGLPGRFGIDADATHSRIDGQMNLRRLMLAKRRRVQCLRRLDRRHRLGHIIADDGIRLFRRDRAEKQDRRGKPRPPKLHGLFQDRHRQIICPRLHRFLGYGHCAVAVAVRLHHGAEFRSAGDLCPYRPQIAPQRP